MSAVVTPGFGADGTLYAAVCGEGHPRVWTSKRGTAEEALRAAGHHNAIEHPTALSAELDMNPSER